MARGAVAAGAQGAHDEERRNRVQPGGLGFGGNDAIGENDDIVSIAQGEDGIGLPRGERAMNEPFPNVSAPGCRSCE